VATRLRTSTMTHVVWAPPDWLPIARATYEGLHERHPARTIFLVPGGGRGPGVSLDRLRVHDLSDGVFAEVVELRLRGVAARHPASVVLPLLIADLPAFCRWRGEPRFRSGQLDDLTRVVDRLVVDSAEWREPRGAYAELAARFEQVAVSDVAFARLAPWRLRLAELWPGIRGLERLRVVGPRADALLLAGWLRSRLRRDVSLARREADRVEAVWVDGSEVEPPSDPPLEPSDLLSRQLDVFGRDRVYEAAVLAA
jgi:glucose-6-phosphate dehydrogenase assembly protein OpcA